MIDDCEEKLDELKAESEFVEMEEKCPRKGRFAVKKTIKRIPTTKLKSSISKVELMTYQLG